MTLPKQDVREFLENYFVLSHRNIEKDEHVGTSHGYRCDQSAVGTTNGAGGRNVQFVVLAPDETVLHVIPGFWHAEDLIPELQLGLELERLYSSERSERSKQVLYRMLHESHLRRHGKDASTRGSWQSFDRHYELHRAQQEFRDTVVMGEDGKLDLRPVVDVIHQRMLQQRFVKLDDFDLESVVDYGRPFYDNNHMDDGRTFKRAQRTNRKRERELEKEREKAERERRRRIARQ